VPALLAQGYSNKEIAEKLRIGERGVASHCRIIHEKLYVHLRTARGGDALAADIRTDKDRPLSPL
jgi:DNA-binding NarL/FixJ family response regulator